MPNAFITGLAGPDLLPAERAFLAETRPAGIILFARNCQSHDQIRRLVDDARDAIGSDRALVLIDQEGGRVQRLRPPLGRALPAAASYGALYGADPEDACRAAFLASRQTAADLRRTRHQYQLRARARCSRRRIAQRHRQPRVWRDDSAGCGARRRGRGRPHGRRRAPGDEAHPRPWSRDGRQPPCAAGRRHAARCPRSHRLRAVPRARPSPGGDDRACALLGDRCRASGHHLARRHRSRSSARVSASTAC